jgi:hypothetical protein
MNARDANFVLVVQQRDHALRTLASIRDLAMSLVGGARDKGPWGDGQLALAREVLELLGPVPPHTPGEPS